MVKLLKILTFPNPKLNRISREVTKITPEIKELIKNMVYTMHQAGGVGLSAVQVGQLKRITVIEYKNPPKKEEEVPLLILINPQITYFSKDTSVDEEGCLSLPEIFGQVERAEKIKVSFTNERGVKQEIAAQGLLARAVQHEIDHMDGILFPQRMKKEDELYTYEIKEKSHQY